MIDRGESRPTEHVGCTRPDGGRAGERRRAVRGLGKTAGGVHHGLFIAGLKVGKVLAVLEQSLAKPRHVAMAKNAEDGGNQPALPPIALAELGGKKPHQGLGSRKANLPRTSCLRHVFVPYLRLLRADSVENNRLEFGHLFNRVTRAFLADAAALETSVGHEIRPP